MISKSQISFIKSLHQKKIRKEKGLFVVEGLKSFLDFIHSDYIADSVFCTENVMPKLGNLSQNIKRYEISSTELSKISSLTTPQQLLALINIPEHRGITTKQLKGSFTLALDGIQDPGNLGTIIRTADWFGIGQIVCSEDTADCYNTKVVQASMGSLARVQIIYTDLVSFLRDSNIPVFGALLDGKSVYNTDFGPEGILVLGNEGNGIRPATLKNIGQAVTIPRFGKAESLNVAISASIFCSELRRNS
jgi:RNA methyltransferase, TrmH family